MPDNVDGQTAQEHNEPLQNLDTPDNDTGDSDKQDAPEFKYKGRSLKPEEVQFTLQQAEHLDRLRGELATRLESKDKEINSLSDRLARLEGSQDNSKPEGQEFLDQLLEDPGKAYNKLLEDAKAQAIAEMKGEFEGLKKEVSTTVNNQATVNSFFDRYPEMREYDRIKIGSTSLVGHARDELTSRAQREGWVHSLTDPEYAFEMLNKEVLSLSKRIGMSPNKSTEPARDLAERGGSTSMFPMKAPDKKSKYTVEDMRKEMLDAHKALRNRIKPVHMKI